MLSPPGQRGLYAKILGLVASGLGLVLGLTQCWRRSHKGCPRGLVLSHRNHVIYVIFFSDRKLLLALVLNNALALLWSPYTGCECDFLLLINFVGEQAFIYGVFITYATYLASALVWASYYLASASASQFFRPRPRPRPHCFLASLTSLLFSQLLRNHRTQINCTYQTAVYNFKCK